MDYKVFESRVLELMFKTGDRVTAQLAAYRIGTTVEEARTMLETMATHEVVTLESDDNGNLYFELPNRPPPTGEVLSWMRPAPVPMQVPVMMVPAAPMPYIPAEKSVGGAVALSLFFGPLGMLYSTIPGALVMFFAGGAFVVATLGIGIVFYIPGCALWGGLAASAHNSKVRAQRQYVHNQTMAHMQHMHHMQQAQAMRQLPPSR